VFNFAKGVVILIATGDVLSYASGGENGGRFLREFVGGGAA